MKKVAPDIPRTVSILTGANRSSWALLQTGLMPTARPCPCPGEQTIIQNILTLGHLEWMTKETKQGHCATHEISIS